VLDLDVQVEGAFTAVHLLTVLVGADVLTIYLIGRPSIVLLSTGLLAISPFMTFLV